MTKNWKLNLNFWRKKTKTKNKINWDKKQKAKHFLAKQGLVCAGCYYLLDSSAFKFHSNAWSKGVTKIEVDSDSASIIKSVHNAMYYVFKL